ncbi:MAG: type II toxin-antitoxin system VapC family toxin [Candidatus Methylumidiphilus sp.]
MRLLLDTCIIYDWMMGTLTHAQTIELIEQNGAWVSAVSVWEMAIKHGLGKMPLPSLNITEDIKAQGFAWLQITPNHAQAILGLAHHHKDPFDRLLIAQAQCEDLRMVTYDGMFAQYLADTVVLVPS